MTTATYTTPRGTTDDYTELSVQHVLASFSFDPVPKIGTAPTGVGGRAGGPR